MKFASGLNWFLTPTVYRVCPQPGGCKKCIIWCCHIVVRVYLDLDQWNFAKRLQMKLVNHLEGFFIPTLYKRCPYPGGCKKCNLWCSHMFLSVDLDLDQLHFATRQLLKFVSELEGFLQHWWMKKCIMWCSHMMHFLHPPGCEHPLFTVGVKRSSKSPTNFISCFFCRVLLI